MYSVFIFFISRRTRSVGHRVRSHPSQRLRQGIRHSVGHRAAQRCGPREWTVHLCRHFGLQGQCIIYNIQVMRRLRSNLQKCMNSVMRGRRAIPLVESGKPSICEMRYMHTKNHVSLCVA